MNRKTYKVEVKQGWGFDGFGIERNYSEFLMNGTITVSIPRDVREYTVYNITDADTGREWEYDFGKLHGRAVIPLKVRVWFGKSDYVELGYNMRKDGSYYYGSHKHFRGGNNKQYERSRLYKLHKNTLDCFEGISFMYGWLLPDTTKDAIEAELKEATSGKYRFKVLFEYL